MKQKEDKMTKQGQTELLAAVITSVQEVLSNQGQKKTQKKMQKQSQKKNVVPPQFQTKQQVKEKQVKTVFVQEPFYMKNGEEQMPMITQGAARNVPTSLRIVKRLGDKAITMERYRARMQEYINVRPIVKRGSVEALGLREVENKPFETTNEAAKIIMDLIRSLGSTV